MRLRGEGLCFTLCTGKEEKTREQAGERMTMCISYKVKGVARRKEMLRGELASLHVCVFTSRLF